MANLKLTKDQVWSLARRIRRRAEKLEDSLEKDFRKDKSVIDDTNVDFDIYKKLSPPAKESIRMEYDDFLAVHADKLEREFKSQNKKQKIKSVEEIADDIVLINVEKPQLTLEFLELAVNPFYAID